MANQFRVSWGYSKNIRAHQVCFSSKERAAQQRHGPRSRMTEAVQLNLRIWLSGQPDLTEHELRERLAIGGVSNNSIGKVLRKMA